MKPMEARHVKEVPAGPGWVYEPKYDGFRCLAERCGDKVVLHSKNGKDLARYFPEMVPPILAISDQDFILDGELMLRAGSFGSLQMRLHPAKSRVTKLSSEMPARLIAFDLLRLSGNDLRKRSYGARRTALRDLLDGRHPQGAIQIGEQSDDPDIAIGWLGRANTDGLVIKRDDSHYREGARAFLKYKPVRTIDCVVGGAALRPGTGIVERLLLGLYDEGGLLQYVGYARVGRDGQEMGELLLPIAGGLGFTGRQPKSVDRWTGAQHELILFDPRLVAEVRSDHVAGGFLRHGSTLVTFRPDKAPEDCLLDQMDG
ncbi:hypothetical protein ACEUZ9_002884 [Paracoccus litorisediminis]|uniref:ATP-dependent DNA ligase n=1 Tax=Paracoccus litorisediminis TaxID=2006130 RepID=UPI0037305709